MVSRYRSPRRGTLSPATDGLPAQNKSRAWVAFDPVDTVLDLVEESLPEAGAGGLVILRGVTEFLGGEAMKRDLAAHDR
jgi:hypothetical protein